ncbi:MAG: hypothetical protein KC668_24540 [Myxococcales bacterium]|nr:hypothetical protein [Myxococcales bacterium]
MHPRRAAAGHRGLHGLEPHGVQLQRRGSDVPLTNPARRGRPDLAALLGWGAATAVFAFLALGQAGLQQDDPYHLALAELLAGGELPRALPWAKHTILADGFSDLHLGYHALLAPFVLVLGGVVGGKVLTVLSVATLLVVLLWVAGPQHPARGLLPLLLLGASGVFLLRSMGMRPIPLAAAATLAVIPLAARGRHRLLALVSALYAFSYAAFPLLTLPLLAHVLARAATRRELAVRPVLAVALGALLGVLAHPNLSAFLTVLRVQLFEVAVDHAGGNLEYAAPGVSAFARDAALACGALLLGGIVACREPRALDPSDGARREELLAWGLLALMSLLLALRHVRGVDTFVPVAVAAAAVATRSIQPRATRAPTVLLGLLVLPFVVLHAHAAFTTSRAFERIDASGAATWLARHTDEGAEVFLQDYGAFPRLFRANRHNVYTLGLDPGFMRAHDPDLYRAYDAAVRLSRDPLPLIERLGARYVYVENSANGRAFYEHLRRHPARYAPAYQDSFAAVFVVRRSD